MFEQIPETSDWGKLDPQSRSFLNSQVAIHGKKRYVQFGKDVTNGVLKVSVVDARLDRDVEMIGKMDPYVVLEHGKSKFKTKTHDDGGKTPEWGESFDIEINDHKSMLEIKVQDDQPMWDRGIGSTQVRVDQLCLNGGLDKQWPLKFEEENAGSIRLKTEWFPNDAPAAVLKHKGKKVQTVKKDVGFEGQMVNGKRTGKAKQYYEEGSLFDGYMIIDTLVQGKFYFANGDLFEGTFENNEMKNGTYIRTDDRMECTGATFKNGQLTGTPTSLTFSTDENLSCTFKGSFVESRPHGKGMLTYGNKIASGNWVNGVLEHN